MNKNYIYNIEIAISIINLPFINEFARIFPFPARGQVCFCDHQDDLANFVGHLFASIYVCSDRSTAFQGNNSNI